MLDEHVRDRIIAETNGNPLAILELPRELTFKEFTSGLALRPGRGLATEIEISLAPALLAATARRGRLPSLRGR